MVSTTLCRELPLGCPSCGSSEISLTYTAPVRVHVREREVVSVRLDDRTDAVLWLGALRDLRQKVR
jgi:hypothetical protein